MQDCAVARPTKAERLKTVHAEALRQFDIAQSAAQDERRQCVEDRRFYSIAGAQWEGDWADTFANRPKLEVNKVHNAVMRIVNEYRNNRIDVSFVAKDGEESELADICASLYRADCQDSCAEEAHDNAFEEAVGGGFGAFRLINAYEDEYDEEDEKQRIRIEPIFDADSCVYFDPNAKRQDKADAQWCFVLTAMTRDAYKDEYGDDPATWPKGDYETEYDWSTPDEVYIAEYYAVEEASELVSTFVDIEGEEKKYRETELTEEKLAELEATGSTFVSSRKVKTRKIRKYMMSGGKVLSDEGYIAGKCIPIVPVYGKRWFIGGVERMAGAVRYAKDMQRLKNIQVSRLAEIGALPTVSKPIFTPQQVAGHEMLWASDMQQNYPYMMVNPVTDANGNEAPMGPVGATTPPDIPPAMAALLQVTETDIADILGNQERGEELQPQMSGRAVELVQNRLDMQAFIYMSNFAKAIRRSGEIWLSMASDLYVEEKRKMKSVGLQGQTESVMINVPKYDPEEGEIERENDMAEAKFDVAVEVGPSSSSKRAATVRALTGMMAISPDPATQSVLGAAAMMNMEGEGLQSIRKWFRMKLVQMGVEEPTDAEAEEMALAAQNAQPDPQALYLQAAAQEAAAKAQKAQADTEYALARSEEAKANTIETLAGIDTARQGQVLKTAETLSRLTSATQPSGVTGEPTR